MSRNPPGNIRLNKAATEAANRIVKKMWPVLGSRYRSDVKQLQEKLETETSEMIHSCHLAAIAEILCKAEPTLESHPDIRVIVARNEYLNQ